jgi:hypothetical protein
MVKSKKENTVIKADWESVIKASVQGNPKPKPKAKKKVAKKENK